VALDGDDLAAVRVDGVLAAFADQFKTTLLQKPDQIAAFDAHNLRLDRYLF